MLGCWNINVHISFVHHAIFVLTLYLYLHMFVKVKLILKAYIDKIKNKKHFI
jgi:hypothetical protein